MKFLSTSIIYFNIDVTFENAWLEKLKNANKNMKIVNMNSGIQKLKMEEHYHEGEHEEVHNNEYDSHVWLNPLMVKTYVKNIYDTLSG